MSDLLRLVLDALQTLSPVRPVFAWERGVYLTFGRYWRTVGPGLWPAARATFRPGRSGRKVGKCREVGLRELRG